MNHKRVLLLASNLLLILLLLVSCGKTQPTSLPIPPTKTSPSIPSIPTADEATIKQIVIEAGKVEPLAAEKDEVTERSEEQSEDGKTRYMYEKHDVVDNIDSIVYLGLNDDIIWPGSLVRGDKAHDFVYEPISIDRAPITLSISLEGSPATGKFLARQVDDPKLSTVRQGISNLLKDAITTDTRVPAKVEFSYQQIYNESQMNLFVGANVSYGVGNLSTSFSWDSATKKNKIMAKYRQIYYSIDVDPPQSPADFFASSTTAPRLMAAIPAGSRPMYIAGVSYGMMALMFIETDSSEENMKAALDAAYNGIVDVEVTTGMSAKEILESSSIKIVVYGGSTAGLKDLETGYQGFKNVIEASKDFDSNSPGVPLIYKFRHLSDNTLALVTLTSQYTLTRPIQLVQRVKITLVSFTCTKSADGWDDPATSFSYNADVDRLFVGYNAYNKNKTSDNATYQIINKPPYIDISGFGSATQIYWYVSGGWGWQPASGAILEVGQSFYIDFNTDPKTYDYELARIDFGGYARDYDWAAGNRSEHSYGKMTVYWEDFLSNSGVHTFLIDGSDVTLKVEVKIEIVD